MAKLFVEIISAVKIERVETIDASTPIGASIMIGAPVTHRSKQDRWIKVTPTGAQASYQFIKACDAIDVRL